MDLESVAGTERVNSLGVSELCATIGSRLTLPINSIRKNNFFLLIIVSTNIVKMISAFFFHNFPINHFEEVKMLFQRNNFLICCIIFSANYILHNNDFLLFIHRNNAREYCSPLL